MLAHKKLPCKIKTQSRGQAVEENITLVKVEMWNIDFIDNIIVNITRIYGHLRWPFFSPFGYGKLLELVSICNSLNNSEGMTIFGRNDSNTEGMTIIRKE